MSWDEGSSWKFFSVATLRRMCKQVAIVYDRRGEWGWTRRVSGIRPESANGSVRSSSRDLRGNCYVCGPKRSLLSNSRSFRDGAILRALSAIAASGGSSILIDVMSEVGLITPARASGYQRKMAYTNWKERRLRRLDRGPSLAGHEALTLGEARAESDLTTLVRKRPCSTVGNGVDLE